MKPPGEGARGRSAPLSPSRTHKGTPAGTQTDGRVPARPGFPFQLKKQKFRNQVPKLQCRCPTNDGSSTRKRWLCPRGDLNSSIHAGHLGARPAPATPRSGSHGANAGQLTSSCSKWAGIWAVGCLGPLSRGWGCGVESGAAGAAERCRWLSPRLRSEGGRARWVGAGAPAVRGAPTAADLKAAAGRG